MSIFNKFPKLKALDEALEEYKNDRTKEDLAMEQYVQERMAAAQEVNDAYEAHRQLSDIMKEASEIISNADASFEDRALAQKEMAYVNENIDAVMQRIEVARKAFSEAVQEEEQYRNAAQKLLDDKLKLDRANIANEAKDAVVQQMHDIGEGISEGYNGLKTFYQNTQARGAQTLAAIGDEVQTRIKQVPTQGLKAFTGISNFASHAYRHFCELDRKDLAKKMDKLLAKEQTLDSIDAFFQKKGEQLQAIKDAAKPLGQSIATFAGVPQKSEEEKAAKAAEKAAKQSEKKPGLFGKLFQKKDEPAKLSKTDEKKIGFFRNHLNKQLNKTAKALEETYTSEIESYSKEMERLKELREEARYTNYHTKTNAKGVTFEQQMNDAREQLRKEQQAISDASKELFGDKEKGQAGVWEDRDVR